jgi:hypothetical protein
MSKDEGKDLAVVTAYFYGECFDKPSFMSHIDIAVDLAKKFVKIFPYNTDWEQFDNTWEEEMYAFYLKQDFIITRI